MIEWGHLNREMFDRVVEALARRIFVDADEFQAIDGRGGDAGRDIVLVENGRRRILQLKYFTDGFPGNYKGRRRQIQRSFDSALKHSPAEWSLVIPSKLTPGERHFVEGLGAGSPVKVSIIDRPELDSWLASNPDIQTSFENSTIRNAREAQDRFPDLFQKSVDHLDSVRAHTRMAGLRTLIELGRDNPSRRQLLVDTVCMYLRTPFDSGDVSEREVRRTAQNLLAEQLVPSVSSAGSLAPDFWRDIDVDLQGAVLHEARFWGCEFRRANFDGTVFVGDTSFEGAHFAGEARFVQAVFKGWCARFGRAVFDNISWFRWAEFEVAAEFMGASFGNNAEFSRSEFRRSANFAGARAGNHGWFTHIIFHAQATFENSSMDSATFFQVDFMHAANFAGAEFRSSPPRCVEVRAETDLPKGLVHQFPDTWKGKVEDMQFRGEGNEPRWYERLEPRPGSHLSGWAPESR